VTPNALPKKQLPIFTHNIRKGGAEASQAEIHLIKRDMSEMSPSAQNKRVGYSGGRTRCGSSKRNQVAANGLKEIRRLFALQQNLEFGIVIVFRYFPREELRIFDCGRGDGGAGPEVDLCCF